MPPGISDAILDLIRLVKGIKFLIVTMPSPLAFETVKKLLGLLAELKVPVFRHPPVYGINCGFSISPLKCKLLIYLEFYK
jgi:hypothetical protein